MRFIKTHSITDAMPKQIFMPKEKSANVAQYRQVIMAMKRAKASLMVCFLLIVFPNVVIARPQELRRHSAQVSSIQQDFLPRHQD